MRFVSALALTTVAQLAVALIAWLQADDLFASTLVGVPTVNVIAVLVTASTIFAFAAYFVRTVTAVQTVLAAVLTVAGLIAFNAGVHSGAGLICGTICPHGGFLSATQIAETELGQTDPPPPLLKVLPQDDGNIGNAPENFERVTRDAWASIYFSVVTMTTLGYGDFQPLPQMRIIAAFQALSGYLILGLAVGILIDYGARRRAMAGSALAKKRDLDALQTELFERLDHIEREVSGLRAKAEPPMTEPLPEPDDDGSGQDGEET